MSQFINRLQSYNFFLTYANLFAKFLEKCALGKDQMLNEG